MWTAPLNIHHACHAVWNKVIYKLGPFRNLKASCHPTKTKAKVVTGRVRLGWQSRAVDGPTSAHTLYFCNILFEYVPKGWCRMSLAGDGSILQM